MFYIYLLIFSYDVTVIFLVMSTVYVALSEATERERAAYGSISVLFPHSSTNCYNLNFYSERHDSLIISTRETVDPK